jgi:hypothetical protein
MRILVTGSRNWIDDGSVAQAITDVIVRETGVTVFPGDYDVTIVTGGASGADTQAGALGHMFGCKVEVHPAQWNTHLPDCSEVCLSRRVCRRAGYVRNAKMVKLGADICLAFIRDDSRGATMCADLAEKAGIPTVRYEVTSGTD